MRNLLALALATCVVPALAVADVQVECPPNMVLSETGCRPRAKAAKKSPAATHERALELVVGDPKQALALFEEACTKKHGAACLNVGRFHATGRHWATLKIVKDPVKASEYFARGCERGNGRACYHHAVLATDVAEGRRRAERGCKLGDGVACAQVAILLEREQRTGSSVTKAQVDAAFKAARKKLEPCTDGEACFARGNLAARGIGEKTDDKKAEAAYRRACELKFAEGCTSLARRHDRVAGEEPTAIARYEDACRLGSAGACATLSLRPAIAAQAPARPLELATRACDLDKSQCDALARHHERTDAPKATAIYKDACDAGDRDSCVAYAERLTRGAGVPKDPKRAEELLDNTCKRGEVSACTYLARRLSDKKTSADDARAYALAKQGCDKRDRYACYLQGAKILTNRRGQTALATEAAAKEARPLFEISCTAGSALGCHELAQLHRDGIATTKDPKRAHELFSLACFADDAVGAACVEVAKSPADPEVALRARGRACAFQARGACLPLAKLTDPKEIAAVVAELAERCKSKRTEEQDNDACWWEARVRTEGTTADRKRALEIHAARCKLGLRNACSDEASLIHKGIGTTADPARAEQRWKELCDDRVGRACLALATTLQSKRDVKSAKLLLDKACDLGVGDACGMAGFYLQYPNPPFAVDVEKAMQRYEAGCKLDGEVACTLLAAMYKHGIGRAVDSKQSYQLYVKACSLGLVSGCVGAASFVARGEGGAVKDVAKATAVLREACEQDQPHHHACVELAALIAEQTPNDPEIERLRERALRRAKDSIQLQPEIAVPALYWLATYHRDGIATPKDPAEARKLFEQACERYHALGCAAAAQMWAASTEPGAKDKAKHYTTRACSITRLVSACPAKP